MIDMTAHLYCSNLKKGELKAAAVTDYVEGIASESQEGRIER